MTDVVAVRHVVHVRQRGDFAHLWDNVAVAVLLKELKSQRSVNRPLWYDLLEMEYAARHVDGLDD